MRFYYLSPAASTITAVNKYCVLLLTRTIYLPQQWIMLVDERPPVTLHIHTLTRTEAVVRDVDGEHVRPCRQQLAHHLRCLSPEATAREKKKRMHFIGMTE